MGYYRRRGRSRFSYGATEHVSQRTELSRQFGGIDKDIESIFLGLSNSDLNIILKYYEGRYGSKAAAYARETYLNWRSGSVRMSGQTAARLMELIPPVLSSEARFDLVKKLRAHYLGKLKLSVRTSPLEWRQDLAEPLQRLVAASSSVAIPREVLDKAAWLANGDAIAAQQLLAASERDEAAVRLLYIEEEMRRIEALIQDIDSSRHVSHTLTLPQGTITLIIELPARTLLQRLKGWIG